MTEGAQKKYDDIIRIHDLLKARHHSGRSDWVYQSWTDSFVTGDPAIVLNWDDAIWFAAGNDEEPEPMTPKDLAGRVAKLESSLASLERTVNVLSECAETNGRTMDAYDRRHNAHVQWHMDQRRDEAKEPEPQPTTPTPPPPGIDIIAQVLNQAQYLGRQDWKANEFKGIWVVTSGDDGSAMGSHMVASGLFSKSCDGSHARSLEYAASVARQWLDIPNSNRSLFPTQPLTLAQAVEVLNRKKHNKWDRWDFGSNVEKALRGEVFGFWADVLTEFEAVAIAEKYLREESQ